MTNIEKEDDCLLNLLEGMCLRNMGCPLQVNEDYFFLKQHFLGVSVPLPKKIIRLMCLIKEALL